MSWFDPQAIRSTLTTPEGTVAYYPLAALGDRIGIGLDRLPVTVKVLLENVLRHAGTAPFSAEDVLRLAAWAPGEAHDGEFPFLPARVLHQDFTGVPVMVDLAAMRDAVARLGGDPRRVNPIVPADLVIDHSVQVDVFGLPEAFARNVEFEYARNRERYMLLRWAQRAFDDLRVVPPGTGIVHQVNLEYLSPVIATRTVNGATVAMPDTLVGTDSHTTMINGLGVLGYGVGGIEAEAVMLGQPLFLRRPEVVGLRLLGGPPGRGPPPAPGPYRPPAPPQGGGRPLFLRRPEVVGLRLVGDRAEGVTATDLVLTVTQLLRKVGVVGKFVEVFGPAIGTLALPDRATIANMSPEFGATATLFPVDNETLAYLRLTGRSASQIALVEAYTRAQGLFRTPGGVEPLYDQVVELDLGTVQPSLAGPRRPQDRVPLGDVGPNFRAAFAERMTAVVPGGPPASVAVAERPPVTQVRVGERTAELAHGSVVIAAITSCTNTSNPEVMVAAGLLAKKAVERGLRTAPGVKTSLAPGSAVVTAYLTRAGLTPYLEALGYHVVGFGCTTCIGNSGPLPQPVADAIEAHDLVTVAVLSGNRNFEGRIHPLVRASYLASPPLVVAFALAGTVNIDLTREPIGMDRTGRPVYLADIWPTDTEVREAVASAVSPEMFAERYRDVFRGDETWAELPIPESELYRWDPDSTYVRRPPFFENLALEPRRPGDIRGARVLAWLGESVTTDHISPAGAISKDTPAARYLIEHGVQPADFNTYGSRRGNHEVMMRGTFANVRLRNRLAGGREGGWTTHIPSGEGLSIYDAAMRYQAEGTPLIVLAGAEYGSGSSRDWAAKGPMLLGVRAVLAQSFERIHRSNLVGLGVLPLQLPTGETADTLGLDGSETFDVTGIDAGVTPGRRLRVTARRTDGTETTFEVIARLDTPIDVEYYRHGGILPFVTRKLVREKTA